MKDYLEKIRYKYDYSVFDLQSLIWLFNFTFNTFEDGPDSDPEKFIEMVDDFAKGGYLIKDIITFKGFVSINKFVNNKRGIF